MLSNYLFDNSLTFYGIFAGAAVILGYSLYNSIWYNSGSNSTFDSINTDITTSLDDKEISFDDIETWFDSFYLEYVAQTTPKSVSSGSGLNIRELKLNEIIRLYSDEMFHHVISKRNLIDIIDSFSITELYSSNINGTILSIIENANHFGPFHYCLC